MSKRELFKFFCYMFLAVCLIALIILGICSFFYYLIPIDVPGTVGEWITALSTLAGGALTLGGVWWTINNTKEEKKKELFFQYRPIITSQSLIYFDKDKTFSMMFENKGLSELMDITFSCDKSWVEFKTNIGSDGRNVLMPNSKYGFHLNCPYDQIKNCQEISFTIKGRTYLNVNLEVSFTFKVKDLSDKINLILIKTIYNDDLTK